MYMMKLSIFDKIVNERLIEHCNYSCYRIRDPLTLVTSKLNASISRDCRQFSLIEDSTI